MPVIRKEDVVAANSTINNIITGSIFEYIPWNASVSIGANASATGLVITINSGSDTVLEEAPCNVKATFPIVPDDMDVQDVAQQGERLVLKVRNTTAGPLTLRTLVQLTPL